MQKELLASGVSGKVISRWIKVIIIVYSLTGFALYYFQDSFLFHPVPLPRNHNYNFPEPYRELNIPYDAVSNLNVIQFTTAASIKKGVVLYFHGNKKNISWYAKHVAAFTKHGYEVWMPDYPGFGKSTGKLTEKRLDEYAVQVYKLARARFGSNDIIIYGKSLGTGIASYLASVSDCKELILETPYYSMHSLMSGYFPVFAVSKLIHYRFPVFEYLPEVNVPVTIFHGTSDWVIPYSNAKQLQAVLKPGDQFVTIEGGSHNDLNDFPLMQQKLDSLLEK